MVPGKPNPETPHAAPHTAGAAPKSPRTSFLSIDSSKPAGPTQGIQSTPALRAQAVSATMKLGLWDHPASVPILVPPLSRVHRWTPRKEGLKQDPQPRETIQA